MIELLSIGVIGRGWAKATIANDEKEVTICGSYLSDGLNELILSCAILFEGANNSSCVWQDTPGEFQWFFVKGNNSLSIKIVSHETNFGPIDDNGEVVFVGKGNLIRFGHRILSEFEKIRLEIGEQGYKNYWNYDFPSKELDRLRQSMKNKNI